MNRIDSTTTDEKTLLEALKGQYGTLRMRNGVFVLFQGRLVHLSGLFDGTQEVIEIPKLPERVPVIFTGDDFSCMSLAEPNAGFVKVPVLVKEKKKKFAIIADCVLNV